MLKPPPAAPLQVVKPLPGWPADMEVALLRTDLVHAHYGGNKYYKLYYNLVEAQRLGLPLLTFGGAYSNHIAATAAAAAEAGIAATGIIRGDELDAGANEVLRFAASCGMQLHFVNRSEYRRRYDADYHSELAQRFGAFYCVPEGGSNALAVKGFAHVFPPEAKSYAHIVCATGTGGTLAGLAAFAGPQQLVTGVAVVNDGVRIRARVEELLAPYEGGTTGTPPTGDFSRGLYEGGVGGSLPGEDFLGGLYEGYTAGSPPSVNFSRGLYEGGVASWRLEVRFTGGGYGKVSPELEAFCGEVSAGWGIRADAQYVGKMLFGVNAMVGAGEVYGRILVVCSGSNYYISK